MIVKLEVVLTVREITVLTENTRFAGLCAFWCLINGNILYYMLKTVKYCWFENKQIYIYISIF